MPFNTVPFPSTQTVLVNGVPKILATRPSNLRSSPTVRSSSPTRPDILLNPDGSVAKTYAVLFDARLRHPALRHQPRPDGTSFWTADSSSGDIWQIDIATGDVMQTIDTGSGTLFGLSVDDQIEVAGPANASP